MTILFLKENIIMKMSGKNRWRRKYPIMQIEKKKIQAKRKRNVMLLALKFTDLQAGFFVCCLSLKI